LFFVIPARSIAPGRPPLSLSAVWPKLQPLARAVRAQWLRTPGATAAELNTAIGE